MDLSPVQQLGLAVLGWLLYFLAVYFICNLLYTQVRGQPPRNPDAPVIIEGRPVLAMTVWQERDRRLRRLFTVTGLILMSLPLLLPLVLRWL